MSKDTKEFTREELYSLAWKRPLTKLAPELGLSDSGLGKICRRYQILLPGAGYWSKVKHGKPTRRKSLKPHFFESISFCDEIQLMLGFFMSIAKADENPAFQIKSNSYASPLSMGVPLILHMQ